MSHYESATVSPTAPSAVRAVNVRKIYGKCETIVDALSGINVEFQRGQFTAIMGPSGSGKSTLMHVMAGLDSITSGELFIGDRDITKLKEKKLTLLRRDQIGFIFQAFNLIPTLTARENIVLPQALAGRKVDEAWLSQVVEMVGLEDRLGHRPNELSGGQQQRVAVARALAGKPDIVFADEPTGNLDSKSGAEVLNFMRKAVDDYGQTIVMVTHDAHAASYADRAVFLSDGKIVKDLANPTTESLVTYIAGGEG